MALTETEYIQAYKDFQLEYFGGYTLAQAKNILSGETGTLEDPSLTELGRSGKSVSEFQKIMAERYPEERASYILAHPPESMPWYMSWGAPLIFLGAVAGGAAVGGAFTGAEAGAAAGSEALFVSGEYVAYDAALALGASEGVGLAATGSTIATGAEVVAGGGLFSSITSGLKSTAEVLGVSGLFKGVLETGGAKISSLIDREVSSLFGGEEGKQGMPGQVGTSSGMGSFLPYILIGITLLGAFILTRKKRR
jgi:hypothetical protein